MLQTVPGWIRPVLRFDTLTISPLESTIQIFLMHSSLGSPSFSMAIVISSAIPIAAWRGRTKAKTGQRRSSLALIWIFPKRPFFFVRCLGNTSSWSTGLTHTPRLHPGTLWCGRTSCSWWCGVRPEVQPQPRQRCLKNIWRQRSDILFTGRWFLMVLVHSQDVLSKYSSRKWLKGEMAWHKRTHAHYAFIHFRVGFSFLPFCHKKGSKTNSILKHLKNDERSSSHFFNGEEH